MYKANKRNEWMKERTNEHTKKCDARHHIRSIEAKLEWCAKNSICTSVIGGLLTFTIFIFMLSVFFLLIFHSLSTFVCYSMLRFLFNYLFSILALLSIHSSFSISRNFFRVDFIWDAQLWWIDGRMESSPIPDSTYLFYTDFATFSKSTIAYQILFFPHFLLFFSLFHSILLVDGAAYATIHKAK